MKKKLDEPKNSRGGVRRTPFAISRAISSIKTEAKQPPLTPKKKTSACQGGFWETRQHATDPVENARLAKQGFWDSNSSRFQKWGGREKRGDGQIMEKKDKTPGQHCEKLDRSGNKLN